VNAEQQVLHVVQMNLHAITIYAFHYAGSVTMTTIAMTTLMKEIVRTEAVEQTNFNVDLAVVSQASGGAMVIMTVETVLMKEAALSLAHTSFN